MLRVVTRRVYDVDHPRVSSITTTTGWKRRERRRRKKTWKEATRLERGTRRCVYTFSFGAHFHLLSLVPLIFWLSLQVGARRLYYSAAGRLRFGEQPDIFIVGKSMMAQIFTSLRLVFSIIVLFLSLLYILFSSFFLSSLSLSFSLVNGQHRENNKIAKPVIVFCFWAKSRLELIQSAPERPPKWRRWGHRLEKTSLSLSLACSLANSLSQYIYKHYII